MTTLMKLFEGNVDLLSQYAVELSFGTSLQFEKETETHP